jgi:hypothetical protein
MDANREISSVIGDLGLQVAFLQANARMLREENAGLRQQLEALQPAAPESPGNSNGDTGSW